MPRSLPISGSQIHPHRLERDERRIDELIKELNNLKFGAIKQFPWISISRGTDEEVEYVKIVVGEEYIWMPHKYLWNYAWAVELQTFRWYEWHEGKLKIHRIKVV